MGPERGVTHCLVYNLGHIADEDEEHDHSDGQEWLEVYSLRVHDSEYPEGEVPDHDQREGDGRVG